MDAAARLITTAFPRQTLLLAGGAAVVFFWPVLSGLLIYDRTAIADGEWWRLLSGNLVHYSALHFVYNVAAVLVAGTLVELRGYSRLWLVCLVAAAAIGAAIYTMNPELRYFGGLSGIATAVIVYLCLNGLTETGAWRTLCRATLALVSAKIVAEVIFDASLMPYGEPQPFVPVPLSHAVGAIAALLVFLLTRRLQSSQHAQAS